ncbi:hypothetical protein NE237_008306 [Protea cynaroides]|uniref:Uncharacterized protein n=1 Tax=Protea cynaroides TaxID=273540 RepID=A0A9Q0GKQ3_9MAGN|nr:hypothetical protein NE237_008306 [Protea cynaroides]
MLRDKVTWLTEAGVEVEYISGHSLVLKEPALDVGKEGGAAFLPEESQLDALRAVAFIEKLRPASIVPISQGHHLVVENFNCFCLNHGLMEVGYISHQAALHSPYSVPRITDHEQNLSISMTATVDPVGNLVLGNCRISTLCFSQAWCFNII